MKAWHIDKYNGARLMDDEQVVRQSGEVKLKLSRVAVPASDLGYFANDGDGTLSVAGHSAVAFVSEADDMSYLKLGSRVAISPYVRMNVHGESVVKTMGVDIDGLMKDFVSVPAENVFPLPDGISDEQAVFADYIAMGNKVFGSLSCDKGDYVAIVSGGTLGQILCQLAAYYQLMPVLIDVDASKLELAKQWDVVYAFNATFDNLERRVEEITGGRMCDAAVFAGEGIGLNASLRLVKNGGEVIIAGYYFKERHQVDMNIILRKQLQLKGVCNGDGEFSSAINLLANRIVNTNGLISGQAYFEDAGKLLEECKAYPQKHSNILFSIG